MLKAFALPAAKVPAKIVAIANPKSGNPSAAKTIAGNVETSRSSTTRNFIRSRYPRIALLTRQDYSAFRSTPPRPLTGIIVTLLSTKGFAMTENNKPEWFEITDADEKPALRKVSKTLPVSAVLVTALVLGVGAVVAQTQNQTPASATSAGVQQTQSAEANPTAAAVVGGVAANKLANPSIANLPTGGGDDDNDEEDNHHGRGHHDEDHEEGDDD